MTNVRWHASTYMHCSEIAYNGYHGALGLAVQRSSGPAVQLCSPVGMRRYHSPVRRVPGRGRGHWGSPVEGCLDASTPPGVADAMPACLTFSTTSRHPEQATKQLPKGGSEMIDFFFGAF